ncbi:MAG: MarR family transcriptional regulator [Rothia sp. (in: high G+C Gram-positive bacteria)]|nr:MarR family transcriptional regulator [Rothia sp. (in: high G+C Gram-positive bacteria)]
MLEHSWNNQLKELGLTHAGVTALGVIAKAGTISQVHVASIVGVQAQTMGKTLARLESHGHVYRTRNTVDRRSYLLGVTPKGKEVLAQAENIDSRLASVGELADPRFREMLVNIVLELSREQGTEKYLAEHGVDSSLTEESSLTEASEAQKSSGINMSDGDGPVTAVLDVITPEMLEAAKGNH